MTSSMYYLYYTLLLFKWLVYNLVIRAFKIQSGPERRYRLLSRISYIQVGAISMFTVLR